MFILNKVLQKEFNISFHKISTLFNTGVTRETESIAETNFFIISLNQKWALSKCLFHTDQLIPS